MKKILFGLLLSIGTLLAQNPDISIGIVVGGGGGGGGGGTVSGTTGSLGAFTSSTAIGDATVGEGIIVASGEVKVDSALIPRFYTGAGAPSAANTAGRDYYFDTTAKQTWVGRGGTSWDLVSSNVVSAVDTGGDDTYVPTCTGFPAAYVSGQALVLQATTANTGAATLDCGPGAKAVKLPDGTTDPANGDIAAKRPALLQYDSSANGGAGAWLVLVPGSGGSSTYTESITLYPVGKGVQSGATGVHFNGLTTAPGSANVDTYWTGYAFDAAADEIIETQIQLPSTWQSATNITLALYTGNGSGQSGNASHWQLQSSCVAVGEALASSFNTVQNLSISSSATASLLTTGSWTVDKTGCAASEFLRLRINRDADGSAGTDSDTGDVTVFKIVLTWTRSLS